ncbi:C25 family cysteine peptidase [Luteolibacter pohnpeiensis]|nr:C25 family cysteine peptidase [Luteolibacter pohnpeiensis]
MAIIRLLVFFIVFASALVSCGPQTLPLEYPGSWQEADLAKQPRWVIAYPASFRSAVKPLRETRARLGYEVIDLLDPKPSEISETVEKLKLGSRKKDCLLIIGTQDQIPSPEGVHGRMQGLPADSRYGLAETGITPLFAVGRLPAENPTEASEMVAKILAFEKSTSTRPQTGLLLVGNPVGKRNFVADRFITSLSKRLMNRAGHSWKFHGAADVGGHPLEVPEADFSRQFHEELTRDYTIGTYFGHSNDWVFAASGSHLTFPSNDWQSIQKSGNKGLFLSCGCFSLQHNGAGGYQALRSPGGPVAYIGASGESYSAIGYLAAQGLMSSMSSNPPETVGEWWLEIQKSIAARPLNPIIFFAFDRVDGSAKSLFSHGIPLKDQRLEHLEMWMLLGDPATRLF